MEITVHALTFELTWVRKEPPFGAHAPYFELNVEPRLSGGSFYQHPAHADVFDAASVLVQGLREGSLDVFTCECGVPGCADIHEDVQMAVRENRVRWTFPSSPFRSRLTAAAMKADGVWVEFDRDQYAQALADLESRINKECAEYEGNWAFAPSHDAIGLNDGGSCTHYLEVCRTRKAAFEAEAQRQADAEGDLRKFKLEARIGEDATFTCSLTELAWQLVPDSSPEPLKTLAEDVRPSVLGDPGKALRSVPADILPTLLRLTRNATSLSKEELLHPGSVAAMTVALVRKSSRSV